MPVLPNAHLYTTQLSDTCELILQTENFLEKLQLVGARCVRCVTQTSSGLVVTAASPLADHWPVIVAGGRAGAPDPSIGVLCFC